MIGRSLLFYACIFLFQHASTDAPSHTDDGLSAPLDLIVMPGVPYLLNTTRDDNTFLLNKGVAFTKDGGRLGHGMGYYDRFLHDYLTKFGSMPQTIALALSPQIVSDNFPVGPNDVNVDLVISNVNESR